MYSVYFCNFFCDILRCTCCYFRFLLVLIYAHILSLHLPLLQTIGFSLCLSSSLSDLAIASFAKEGRWSEKLR